MPTLFILVFVAFPALFLFVSIDASKCKSKENPSETGCLDLIQKCSLEDDRCCPGFKCYKESDDEHAICRQTCLVDGDPCFLDNDTCCPQMECRNNIYGQPKCQGGCVGVHDVWCGTVGCCRGFDCQYSLCKKCFLEGESCPKKRSNGYLMNCCPRNDDDQRMTCFNQKCVPCVDEDGEEIKECSDEKPCCRGNYCNLGGRCIKCLVEGEGCKPPYLTYCCDTNDLGVNLTCQQDSEDDNNNSKCRIPCRKEGEYCSKKWPCCKGEGKCLYVGSKQKECYAGDIRYPEEYPEESGSVTSERFKEQR